MSNLADKARQSQRLWDYLVPERNWSIKSPAFIVLAIATATLYTFNTYYESNLHKDARLEQENIRALRAESKRSMRLQQN